MRFQIQIRGDMGGNPVDWRPVPRIAGEATAFSSWDEAEDELDRLQLAGILPLNVEGAGIELRIVDLAERRRPRLADGMPPRELLAPPAPARDHAL